jgi:hypothetical protein
VHSGIYRTLLSQSGLLAASSLTDTAALTDRRPHRRHRPQAGLLQVRCAGNPAQPLGQCLTLRRRTPFKTTTTTATKIAMY